MQISHNELIIHPASLNEIPDVANFISAGYYHDKFFIWSVPDDVRRHKIVADYYEIYLRAAGAVSHVAETADGKVVGATVWLPHDVDAGMYDDIDRVAGEFAPRFRAVSDKSHDNEPKGIPFYQLVGFVTAKEVQGQGVGTAMLRHNLSKFDMQGIPTYLEASTPYHGGGVYGRFGYQHFGELMVFAEGAILYPLWRPADIANQNI